MLSSQSMEAVIVLHNNEKLNGNGEHADLYLLLYN